MTTNGHRDFFGGEGDVDGNVLELDCGDGCITLPY